MKNGLYQIHKLDGPAYEGQPGAIFETALKLGIPLLELNTAISELEGRNNDYADFDVRGKFMYTTKNPVKK